jgi:predicted nucleic acid-binding protein
MKIFLDANILVSVLNKEYPLYIYSSKVLSLADNSRFTLFTSPICLAIAFYFAEKKGGTALAKKKIQLLASKINITPTDRNTVIQALRNNKINDFEDGLEYYSALAANCKCIITENLSDFHFSSIEILDAQSFLTKYAIRS